MTIYRFTSRLLAQKNPLSTQLLCAHDKLAV